MRGPLLLVLAPIFLIALLLQVGNATEFRVTVEADEAHALHRERPLDAPIKTGVSLSGPQMHTIPLTIVNHWGRPIEVPGLKGVRMVSTGRLTSRRYDVTLSHRGGARWTVLLPAGTCELKIGHQGCSLDISRVWSRRIEVPPSGWGEASAIHVVVDTGNVLHLDLASAGIDSDQVKGVRIRGLLHDGAWTVHIMGPLDECLLKRKPVRVRQLAEGKYAVILTLHDGRSFSGDVDHDGGRSTIRFEHYQPK